MSKPTSDEAVDRAVVPSPALPDPKRLAWEVAHIGQPGGAADEKQASLLAGYRNIAVARKVLAQPDTQRLLEEFRTPAEQLINAFAHEALMTIRDLMRQTDDGRLRFMAAQDILNRVGFRAPDRHEYIHRHETAMQDLKIRARRLTEEADFVVEKEGQPSTSLEIE